MRESTEDTTALELARSLGVHRIVLPTPFGGLRVNVYLVAGERPVLIDAGPNWASALGALESGLAGLGYSLADVGTVLITHHHMDHAGLAGFVAERSGAEIVALHVAADYLVDYEANAEADEAVRERTIIEHGGDADLATALHAASRTIHGFGGSSHARSVGDGETVLAAGTRFRALHRPGHSGSDTVWVDDERRLVFAGDHLLAGVSANAIVDRELGIAAAGRRARSLLDYRRSLLRTRALDADLVLAGHGSLIVDHGALIDERLGRQDERAETLLSLLGSTPRTARDLSFALLGEAARTQVFLALSETLGHLDLLLEAGRAREVELAGGCRGFVRVERDQAPRADAVDSLASAPPDAPR